MLPTSIFWVGRLSGLKWKKRFRKIRIEGRETLLMDKSLILKVRGVEEPGWREEGSGSADVKDVSGTHTALEYVSQGVFTPHVHL